MPIRRLLAALLPLALLAAPAPAQLAPDARFHTLETEHFRVTFQEGLEPVARHAAERAERAHALLSRELVRPPRGRIDLVVAHNVDLANGYATPFPSNRIVVYAHPPVGTASLSYTEDWIELVVLHELVHIFHLDHAGGIWRPLRAVFGRNPVLFPQVYAPGWVVEGLATYFESRLTRGGRVRGTFHDMVLRTAVLEDEFFPIDRATGDPVTWPGGNTRYVYGSLFVDHLSRRHGPERVSEFVRAVGSRLVPYRMDAAARRAFGVSFTRAWEAWEEELRVRYRDLADSLRATGVTEPEVLTAHGRGASFPRFSPDGRSLAYAASTGRDEPSTRVLGEGGSERVVAERSTLGPTAWTPDGRGLLLAQLEYADPYRIHSDLYRLDLAGGEERLSRGARFWNPDPHPDGRRVVGVGDALGAGVLEILDLATGERRPLAEASPGTGWSLPRWSPSGDRIAVARWRAGGLYDVVLLDSAGRVLREVTRDRAVDDAPAWSPDGRWVVFSSDRTGISNLFAYDTREGRLLQATNVLSGAFEPDVSPDGRWIAFSYYRSDGFHIARVPFDPGAWREAPPVRPEAASPPEGEADFRAMAGGEPRPYSPWRSLAPRAWSLLVAGGTDLGGGVGAAAAGADLVDRHYWGAQALVYPADGRLDGALGYRYQGWGNPVLDVVLSQDWSVRAEEGEELQGAPLVTALLERDREARALLSWQRRRWTSTAWLSLGGGVRDLEREWGEPDRAPALDLVRFPLDLGATVEAGYSTVRSFAYSVGPQQGVRLSAGLEGHRYAEPFEGREEAQGYLRTTGRARGYRGFALPGFGRHVLGVRLDAGAESGSVSPGFTVGGASGAGAPLALDLDLFGGGVSFPVRGYPQGAQAGNRAFSASAEYRFPLALVERGVRVLPVFLDRVWGDVFVDAGSAWCPGECERGFTVAAREPSPLVSAGAELNVETTAGFFVDLPFRLGVAVRLRDPEAGSLQYYLRLGRAF